MFYPRLAVTGILKNKKTYFPYILTCIGMIMMYYIITFLSIEDSISMLRGGPQIQSLLDIGRGVLALFSVIFLFYTNSFLIKNRKREFGLYNILGMDKKNIGGIMIWETVIIFLISLISGILCGMLFSRFAQLAIIRFMKEGPIGDFTVSVSMITSTFLIYAAAFSLILLNGLRQIHLSNPIDLLHSTNQGEKQPRANYITAIFGITALVGGYYMANSIENLMMAINYFFIAVILVIIGTYLLFISGSVAILKLLRKKKSYYYKSNHFIAVSSMVFRMKRSGAGLASICILSTAVLVMISSTSSLFIGSEDALNTLHPKDIVIDSDSIDNKNIDEIQKNTNSILQNYNLSPINENEYRSLEVTGYKTGNKISFDQSIIDSDNFNMSNLAMLCIIPLEDYNKYTNESNTLDKDQIMIYYENSNYKYNTIDFENINKFEIKEKLSKFPFKNMSAMISVVSRMWIIVPDMEILNNIYQFQLEQYEDQASNLKYYYGFDLDCDDNIQTAVYNELQERNSNIGTKTDCTSFVIKRADYYGMHGGLFFLGIFLGIICIAATVLIMYYKQITEGYEDRNRFVIMQKVGMTKSEIKKSIHSQMLTVFLLPLLGSAINIIAAFNIIKYLLNMFGLSNTPLFIVTSLICFIIFAVFYIIMYIITSKAYYKIVCEIQQ